MFLILDKLDVIITSKTKPIRGRAAGQDLPELPKEDVNSTPTSTSSGSSTSRSPRFRFFLQSTPRRHIQPDPVVTPPQVPTKVKDHNRRRTRTSSSSSSHQRHTNTSTTTTTNTGVVGQFSQGRLNPGVEIKKATIKRHQTIIADSDKGFEEFDGVADILAVSHVSDKPIGKKRPPISLPAPLLRAKTLPAIISPTIGLLQAQLESRHQYRDQKNKQRRQREEEDGTSVTGDIVEEDEQEEVLRLPESEVKGQEDQKREEESCGNGGVVAIKEPWVEPPSPATSPTEKKYLRENVPQQTEGQSPSRNKGWQSVVLESSKAVVVYDQESIIGQGAESSRRNSSSSMTAQSGVSVVAISVSSPDNLGGAGLGGGGVGASSPFEKRKKDKRSSVADEAEESTRTLEECEAVSQDLEAGAKSSKWRRRRRRRGSDNKDAKESQHKYNGNSSSPRSSLSGASGATAHSITGSKSPNVSPRHSVSSTCSSSSSNAAAMIINTSMPIPTPPVKSKSEGGSGSRASLAKLARLLMSRDKASSKTTSSSNESSKKGFGSSSGSSVASSWQAAAHSVLLKRSASIDSIHNDNASEDNNQDASKDGGTNDSPSSRRISPSSSCSSPIAGSGGRPTPPPAPPPPSALPVLPVVRVEPISALDSPLGGSDPFLIGVTSVPPPGGPAGRRGAITNSPSVPNRLTKGSNIVGTAATALKTGSVSTTAGNSLELVLDTMIPLSKAEKKKLEKWSKFNIDLQALFVSVEQDLYDRAQKILETTDVDVNSVNGDGFTPLDVAVMTSNVAIVKLLQTYGAKESYRFPSKEARSNQLNNLVKEAERCVQDLNTCVQNATTNGTLSAALLKEKEKKLAVWERRENLLKRMKTGFDSICIPDPPKAINIEVVGTTALRVIFQESETTSTAENLVTKYKVQWSTSPDFESEPLAGSREVVDLHKLEMTIGDLDQGTPYYVRVAAGNMKGFSDFQTSTPSCATPSSWRDEEDIPSRTAGRVRKLDDLFHQIINSRPEHSSGVKSTLDLSDSTPQQQRRLVRKSIKNLFTSAPKFQKTMKRGVFLSCLLYNEDRVLVTTEEVLPVVEVDETYPASLQMDFHWLMKVACTWEDVKALRQDMERSHSASNVHFRSKLLQAVEQMQNALGIQDIGHLFYKPLKDSEGTIVLCTVRHVTDPKSISSLSIRWLPLTKIQKKLLATATQDLDTPYTASELLLSSLPEMITYNQVSYIPLPRGLYMGYVKLRSSVDLIRVMVPLKTPNILPHCKIRDNPHVSREEWCWLKRLSRSTETDENGDEIKQEPDLTEPTDVQMKFQKVISVGARTLLSHLDVPSDLHDSHRIYDQEVIELSSDVTLVLLLPPIENVCAVPGQNDELSTRVDFIPLPVQIFEMIHMGTYQSNFIARYSRLSSILETDNMVAQHAHREAFSAVEVAAAKARLAQLQEFQTQVDDTWRGTRWIMDALTFARDKQSQSGNGIALCWIFTRRPSKSGGGSGGSEGERGGSKSEGGSPSRLSPLLVVPPEPEPGGCTLHVPVVTARRLSREEIDQSFLFIATLQAPGDHNKSGGSPMEIRRCASTSHLLQVGMKGENGDTDESGQDYDGGGMSSSSERGDDDDDDDVCSVAAIPHRRPRIVVGGADDTDDSMTMTVSPATSENQLDKDGDDDDDNDYTKFQGDLLSRMYRSRTEDSLSTSTSAAKQQRPLVSLSNRRGSSDLLGTYGLKVEGSALFPVRDDSFLSDASPGTEDELESPVKEGDARFFDSSGVYRRIPGSSSDPGTSAQSDYTRTTYSPDVIRVYAGYASGLPKGTSVRLQISAHTTVREVVDLVVKQLNMATILKGRGGPIYGNNELVDFVLVARVGAREHSLDDSFLVMDLEEPWSQGKLIIRRSTETESTEK